MQYNILHIYTYISIMPNNSIDMRYARQDATTTLKVSKISNGHITFAMWGWLFYYTFRQNTLM